MEEMMSELNGIYFYFWAADEYCRPVGMEMERRQRRRPSRRINRWLRVGGSGWSGVKRRSRLLVGRLPHVPYFALL